MHEVEFVEILSRLPTIEEFNTSRNVYSHTDDLFLCALGFEDRCPWIAERLSATSGYRSQHSVYFQYSTNRADNENNKARLLNALTTFSGSVEQMPCDDEAFPSRLRTLLANSGAPDCIPTLSLDISVCSSSLLVSVLRVVLESDVRLRILYSEAAVYHPTEKEYGDNPEKWAGEDALGLAKGVARVIPSPLHPGNRRDGLPEAVVVFPTFRRERAVAAIADIDESLVTRPKDRVVWLIGKPHLPEDGWRTKALAEINSIPEAAPCDEVCTFDYRRTIEKLEAIYRAKDCNHHVNIVALGSKMQCVGISLFWYVHQDVSIILAVPKEYNAGEYTEGCKATHTIDFGSTKELRKLLDSVGQLSIYG